MDVDEFSTTADRHDYERFKKINHSKHEDAKKNIYKNPNHDGKIREVSRSQYRSSSRSNNKRYRSRGQENNRLKERDRSSVSRDRKTVSRDRSFSKRSRKSRSKERLKYKSKKKKRSTSRGRSSRSRKSRSRSRKRRSKSKGKRVRSRERKSLLKEKQSKANRISRSKERTGERTQDKISRPGRSRRRWDSASRSRERSDSKKIVKGKERRRRSRSRHRRNRSRERSKSYEMMAYQDGAGSNKHHSYREKPRRRSRSTEYDLNCDNKDHKSYEKYKDKNVAFSNKNVDYREMWDGSMNGEQLLKYPLKTFESESLVIEEARKETDYIQTASSLSSRHENNGTSIGSFDFINNSVQAFPAERTSLQNVNHESLIKNKIPSYVTNPNSINNIIHNRMTMPLGTSLPDLNQPPPGFVPFENQTPLVVPALENQSPFTIQHPAMINPFPPQQGYFMNQIPLRPLANNPLRPQMASMISSQPLPRFLIHPLPSQLNPPQPFQIPTPPNIQFPPQHHKTHLVSPTEILQPPSSSTNINHIKLGSDNFIPSENEFYSPPNVPFTRSEYSSDDGSLNKDPLPPPPPPPPENHHQITTSTKTTADFTCLRTSKRMGTDKYSPYSSTSEGSVDDSFANNLFDDSLGNIHYNSPTPEAKNNDHIVMKDELANEIIKGITNNRTITKLKVEESRDKNLAEVATDNYSKDVRSDTLISLAKNLDLSGSLGIQVIDLKKVLETANIVTKQPATNHHNSKSRTGPIGVSKLAKGRKMDQVVEEVKKALKPHFSRSLINKEEYKNIMRRAVPKIMCSKSDLNSGRVRTFIQEYVTKVLRSKKIHRLKNKTDVNKN